MNWLGVTNNGKSFVPRAAIFCFVSLIAHLAIAQDPRRIDSLEGELKKDTPDTVKIAIWNELADEYNNSDSAQTAFYVEKSIALARERDYPKGLSEAYYRIAWSNIRSGDFLIADELCQKALSYPIRAQASACANLTG